MGAADDLQRLGLVIGRVVAAADHVGGRAPSYLLTLDLGPRGRREAVLTTPAETKEALVGRQVVCALDGDDALVLGAHSHARGVVLLHPAVEVEDGSLVV